MTLAEAITQFLENIGSRPSPHSSALQTLTGYFSAELDLDEITPPKLRDFLARSYVEQMFGAGSIKLEDSTATAQLVNLLAEFFKWIEHRQIAHSNESIVLLKELRVTVPRALEIAGELLNWVGKRRGAFRFPEFLTSFEQGGRSEYDIGAPGDVGALEGYFRIVRVEGSMVEAEDLISETRVQPIIFPNEIVSKLDAQYIINLELARGPKGWEILDCGVVYPPGTDFYVAEEPQVFSDR